MDLSITRSGNPALWEKGGGATNTGEAQVVAGPGGEAIAPIYVRGSGSLSNSEHALFPALAGMVVVRASHHRKDFTVEVLRLGSPRQEWRECERAGGALSQWKEMFPGLQVTREWEETLYGVSSEYFSFRYPVWVAEEEILASLREGQWVPTEGEVYSPEVNAAVKAAMVKATCYHCRSPHYVAGAA